MAVVTRLSTVISNYEATPRVLTSGYIAGTTETLGCAIVAAVSTDSIASVYKFGYIPSSVRITDLQLMNDATTAGVWQLGIICNDNQALNMGGPGYSVQTWNSTTAYVTGNVVQYNGVIYYATASSTGSTPPSGNWTTGGAVVAQPGSVPIPNAGMIFNTTGTSTAAANVNWKSVYSPSLGGSVATTAANLNYRVWELLGMVQDPDYLFILTATATTAPTANGNIALQWRWAR
jgi:hypothetical protein